MFTLQLPPTKLSDMGAVHLYLVSSINRIINKITFSSDVFMFQKASLFVEVLSIQCNDFCIRDGVACISSID